MNEAELMQEYTARAKACQLQVDCLGSGRLDSKICIISEAPAEREVLMKMPLVGGSGQILWTILRDLDISRKDCYVTNVIKRQLVISSKVDAKSAVRGPELEHWEGLLDWELDHLPNLKYILILGNSALHALTGDYGITKWRGSVFDCRVGKESKVVKVICTNNPAHILRNMSMEPMFKFDISKLRRVIDGQFKKHTVRGTINPTYKEAVSYIDSLESSDAPIAFDIEIIANETACIGFANNAYTGVCINFRDSTKNRFKQNFPVPRNCTQICIERKTRNLNKIILFFRRRR